MTAAGEFARLAALSGLLDPAGSRVRVPSGDDAAVVVAVEGDLVVATDAIVEGVHFRRDLSTPADIGWKALAVNVSDVAAMGGRTTGAVIALLRPDDLTDEDVFQAYRGLRSCADTHGVALLGGDTVTAPVWAFSVAVIGTVTAPVTRGGASPGDLVVVAGALGAAATALWLDGRGAPIPSDLLAAHRRPVPLAAAGPALAANGATAMIDVSDGLGADLRHLCEASAVGIGIDEAALPVHPAARAALPADQAPGVLYGGGEDFALAATVRPGRVEDALAAVRLADPTIPVAVVGRVTDPPPGGHPAVLMHTAAGRPLPLDDLGYDHG